ncbi:MAG TPA: tetratricopeptide repeat protein [Thermoanaerobaculia bacterium]|nr:tetratricopeptide repeat protein [Thermoanaerobaculia bacterium]
MSAWLANGAWAAYAHRILAVGLSALLSTVCGASARQPEPSPAPHEAEAAAAAEAEVPPPGAETPRPEAVEERLAELEGTWRESPASRAAVESYARALHQAGRYAAAAEAIGKLLAEDPAAVASLGSLQARALSARGRLDEAEKALRATIEARGSAELEARADLGELLFRRGDVAGAEELWYSLIDAYNARERLSAADLTAVARACQHLGRNDPELFKDALKAYDEALAADPQAIEPRIRVGLLFLEKYDSGEARTALADALMRSRESPEALLAMARVHRFDHSPLTRDLVLESLKGNPSSVDARVLYAQLLLELEEYDEALTEASRALEVDPTSLEALSVRAAAHYLRLDEEAFEATRAQVFALNPRYAGFYNRLSETCVQNRLYRQALEFSAEAVELDPRSWQAWGELGLNQLRLGEIEAGRESLEKAFAGDPYNVWNKNTLDLLDSFAEYETVRTERFELFIHRDEVDLLAPYVGALAEEAYTVLAERYQVEPPTPIRIEVYPRHEDFSVRTVGLAGLGALGVCFGPVIAIDSPSARTVGSFNWGTTLWHEITHTFTLYASGHRIPRWLTEGLSVYEERLGREAWGDDVRPEFLQVLRDGKLLGLGRINDGFVRPSYPNQISLSYFQASLIAELIDREWGFDKIRSILAGYRDGKETEQIFEEALGVELEELDRRFFASLEQKYAKALPAFVPQTDDPVDASQPGDEGETTIGEVEVTAVESSDAELERWAFEQPDNFRAQYSWGRRLMELERDEEAIERLRRAKELFPELVVSGSPYHLLAEIHLRRDEKDQAADELRQLVAINEYAYREYLQLAEMLERPEDRAEAIDLLDRALFIYPLELEPHERLAEAAQAEERWPIVARERRAIVALDPPNKAEALFDLSQALLRAGDRDGALREVLAALEIAPGYAEAQRLLLELAGAEGDS